MTPASALSSSKNFYRGFELCYGNGLPTNNGLKNAITPSVVCLAFSIELGLKSILLGCKLPSKGHNLLDLYKKLPDAVQLEISSYALKNNCHFKEKLDSVSQAFVEWRYIFENPGHHSIDIQFFLALHKAITKVAKKYVDEQRKVLASKS